MISVHPPVATGRPVAVVLLSFGEPTDPDPEVVHAFLERIFLRNAGLEPGLEATARARQLADERAPSLVEEYRSIGGSPLNGQADAQARALQGELASRGHTVRTYSAFQFTPPFVEDRVREAVRDGCEVLVGLPVYPLCGQSTTVAALESVRSCLGSHPEPPVFRGVSGWHHHPDYTELRADGVRSFAAERGVDLLDPDTLLHFSVHGTPLRYLAAGNRYDRYVEEHCREVAALIGVDRYTVGFQNHGNRRVAWTQPDNDQILARVSERHVVMVPISFMHEQSETLVELDRDLVSRLTSEGRDVHRVPVPHDASGFAGILADLVEGVLAADARPVSLDPCRCVGCDVVWCTNGARDLPESPYVPARATG